jgi:hypothetical protein
MTYLKFDAGAASLVRALEDAARLSNQFGIAPHQLRLDRAVVALMRVHAADASVPQLLRDESIWGSSTRDQVVTRVDGGPETFITQSGYLNFGTPSGSRSNSRKRSARPAVTERHIVRALIERRGEQFGWLQIQTGLLQRQLERGSCDNNAIPLPVDRAVRTACCPVMRPSSPMNCTRLYTTTNS